MSHNDNDRSSHRENIEDLSRRGQPYEGERQRARDEEYGYPEEQDDYRKLSRHQGSGPDRNEDRNEDAHDQQRAGFSQRGRSTRPGEAHERPERSPSWGGWGDFMDRPESTGGGSQQGMRANQGRTPPERESSAYGAERGRKTDREAATCRIGSTESHPGRFAGLGPKGYQRTDERAKEDICERLSADHDIDASDITVDVRNGEVSLTGTVDSRATKYNVEELVENVMGVKDIDNRIRVNRSGKDRSCRAEEKTNGKSNKEATPPDIRPQRL